MSDLLAIAIDVATAMVCGFLFGVMWERERWEKLREDEMFSRLDRYIERTIGPAPSAGQTLPAETPVLAQLGTGSGAGAQSDSGADSGHATSAVPCLHPSVSEALHLAQRAIEGTLDWDIERKFIVPYKVRDPLHVANAAIYTALAKVEAKEKTR